MRIVSVTAADFGPLQRRTLGLAPGLTVVVGGNEAGKSSWHGALYAALCGRRRARGRAGAADQRFADAHRPWDGGSWTVSAELQLDDGREIEIRHDLAGLVDCRATDIGLNRDVSAEILHEGAPDASLWCGLDRSIFRATACVAQGEVVAGVAADGLQVALQRALTAPAIGAASAGVGPVTAAAAIEDLRACRRESVGRDAAGSVRPLRRAREELAAAQQQLALARAVADELEELGARREAAAREVQRQPAVPPLAASPAPEAKQVGVPAHQRRRHFAARVPAALAAAAAGIVLAASLAGGARAALGCLVAAVLLGSLAALGWRRRRPAVDRAAPPGPSRPAAVEPALTAQRLAQREALLERHHGAQLRLARLESELAARSASVPSLSEAEERLAAARREEQRVRDLDETLGLTLAFLSRAEERVHREVAPELSALVSERLAQVTGGRYTAARIDPADLTVEVRDPHGVFRPARLLSRGTLEQLYLLLRVALVEVLTAGHETCPLLLDDVTVHADPDRTDDLLEMVLSVAAERQVVVFAQQDQVRAWAASRLDGVRHALVELPSPAAGCASASQLVAG